MKISSKYFPRWFYLGLLTNLTAWATSWLNIKPFSVYTFFFIWLGFILIIDGLNYRQNGSSMISRNFKGLLFLFAISTTFWWFFEFAVFITKNWYYISNVTIPISVEQILSGLFFSTVMPAVFEMAELLKTFNLFIIKQLLVRLPRQTPVMFLIMGIAAIFLPLIRPDLFFPLLWVSLFLILDPINYWRGYDSLSGDILENNWQRLLYFGIATLICGFFWEMWNYHASIKWFYEIPYVGSLKIFEMPLLGYLGYIPFGFEIFAVYCFVRGIFGFPKRELSNLTTKEYNYSYVKWAIVSATLLIAATTIISGLIITNNWANLMAKPVVDYIPTITNSELVLNYTGIIKHCQYSFVPGYCLETKDNQHYLLVNNNGETINTNTGEVIIISDTIIKNKIGVDELIANKINYLNRQSSD